MSVFGNGGGGNIIYGNQGSASGLAFDDKTSTLSLTMSSNPSVVLPLGNAQVTNPLSSDLNCGQNIVYNAFSLQSDNNVDTGFVTLSATNAGQLLGFYNGTSENVQQNNLRFAYSLDSSFNLVMSSNVNTLMSFSDDTVQVDGNLEINTGTANEMAIGKVTTSEISFVSNPYQANILINPLAGSDEQPAGRLVVSSDLDVGKGTTWSGSLVVGGTTDTTAGSSIILMTDNKYFLNVNDSDRTIRTYNTVNPNDENGGYIIDSKVNPPILKYSNNLLSITAWDPSDISNISSLSTIQLPSYSASTGISLTQQSNGNPILISNTGIVNVIAGDNIVLSEKSEDGVVTISSTIPSVVNTLNSLDGNVTLTAGTNVSFDTVGNDITINATTSSAEGVSTLNTLIGNITLTAGTNVSFDTVGNDITINATAGAGNVASVAGQTGVITFGSASDSIAINADAGNVDFSVIFPDFVESLNGVYGAGTITSSDGSVQITPDVVAKTIDLSVGKSISGVSSINDKTGSVEIVGSIPIVVSNTLDNTITIEYNNTIVAQDPIVTEVDDTGTITNIYSNNPRIIAFKAVTDGSGHYTYTFLDDNVVPLDSDYIVVASITDRVSGQQPSAIAVTSQTPTTVSFISYYTYSSGQANRAFSAMIALTNYRALIQKTYLVPFSPEAPATQTRNISLRFALKDFVLPPDYQLANNPGGVQLKLYYSGQFTATFTGYYETGLRDITELEDIFIPQFPFVTNQVVDYGTTLPGTISVNATGLILLDESHTYSYLWGAQQPSDPSGNFPSMVFNDVGCAIEMTYWGYN